MILALWAAFPIMGYVLGYERGRAEAGFVWGALLGPLGLIVALLLPRSAKRLEQDERAKRAIRARLDQAAQRPGSRDARPEEGSSPWSGITEE